MAVYIDIVRTNETETAAEYDFSTTSGRKGTLRIDKKTGEVVQVEPAENDDGGLFARAAHKVKSHWSRGELPEKMTWAS